MARVTGRDKVRVPAASVATVMVKGLSKGAGKETQLLMEPVNAPLPPGLSVIPTLVDCKSHIFPVQVVTLTGECVAVPKDMSRYHV